MTLNKRKVLFGASSIFCALIFVLCISVIPSIQGRGLDNIYTLIFNSSKNHFHDSKIGEKKSGSTEENRIKTEHNNNVSFTYTNVMNASESWHVICEEGTFYNTTFIKGILNISISFKTDDKAFKIYYSETPTFSDTLFVSGITSKEDTFSTDFNGYRPNYFKFSNESGYNINIYSFTTSISCVNSYYELNVQSGDSEKGTVKSTHSGLTKVGTSFTIQALPYDGYKFVSWFKDGVKISEDPIDSFVMGEAPATYIANFTLDSYVFNVSCKDSEGTISGTSSGTYEYKTAISVSATPYEGYIFDGWYKDDVEVSESNPYNFSMPYNNLTLEAKFTPISYNLTLKNDEPSRGTISGDLIRTIPYKSPTTLEVICNTGMTFIGWYEDGVFIEGSNKTSWTFNMPLEDHEYHAKFTEIDYIMGITYDEAEGQVSGNGTYHYQDKVTLNATANEGYSFVGWYENEELISKDNELIFSMPAKDLVYEARFGKNYQINIIIDDNKKGNVSGPTFCGAGNEVTLTAKPLDTNALDYWANTNFEEVSFSRDYTFTMPANDITLYVFFTNNSVLVQADYDTSGGTVNDCGYYKEGRIATLSAAPTGDNVFDAWYSDKEHNSILSRNHEYSFTVPSGGITLYPTFIKESEAEWNKTHGVIPVISEDGKTLTYGLYPQTHVSDSKSVAELKEASSEVGYEEYFKYNNEYYIKDVAFPYSTAYTFSTGVMVGHKTPYFFKCEPITWKIISTDDNYLIDCTNIINASFFNNGDNGNDYLESQLQGYINEISYYALSIKNTSKIIVPTNLTDVDVFNENVWIGSKNQYDGGWYSNNFERQKKVSDYAICKGAIMDPSNRNGYYWSRSPYINTFFIDEDVWTVDNNGYLNCQDIYSPQIGISPSCKIKIL